MSVESFMKAVKKQRRKKKLKNMWGGLKAMFFLLSIVGILVLIWLAGGRGCAVWW